MRTVDLEDFTPHYAETLRRWRANFDARPTELDRLGYDERFRRLWRAYLAYCEAGFEERRIGLVQMVIAKPRAMAELGPAHCGAATRQPHTQPTRWPRAERCASASSDRASPVSARRFT